MLIYFAGPLFSRAEQAYNRGLTAKLEALGFTVFLPQRDGVEEQDLTSSARFDDAVRKEIFARDRDKVLGADVFLFVLDGRVPDEGACVELGIAYAQKHLLEREKLLVGLQTDMRAAFIDAKLNAMLEGALDVIVYDEHALFAVLRERLAGG